MKKKVTRARRDFSGSTFDSFLLRHNLLRLKGIGELLLPLPLAKAIDSC